jgi:hypothetical protein
MSLKPAEFSVSAKADGVWTINRNGKPHSEVKGRIEDAKIAADALNRKHGCQTNYA